MHMMPQVSSSVTDTFSIVRTKRVNINNKSCSLLLAQCTLLKFKNKKRERGAEASPLSVLRLAKQAAQSAQQKANPQQTAPTQPAATEPAAQPAAKPKPKPVNVNTPQNIQLANQIETLIAKDIFGKTDTQTVKRVGNIQRYVDILRKAYPDFPKKTGNLTTRLQTIYKWISTNHSKTYEALEQAGLINSDTSTQPAGSTAQQAAPKAQTFDNFEQMQTHANSRGPTFTGRLYYIHDTEANGDHNVYAANYQNGQIVSQTNVSLQESKLIRKMIIQEVYKTLRK